MVSSRVSGLNGTNTCKSILTQLVVSAVPPDAVPTELIEFDFSDVFGPLPAQNTLEADNENTVEVDNDFFYDDPVVIYSRSHSLVGPTNCVSQPLKLSKLPLTETEESLEFLDCVDRETSNRVDALFKDTDVVQKHISHSDHPFESFAIGLEDFEILKVVGQGAFGKVFQTKYRLYLVLDFVNGGHLFFQLYHQGLFREDLARIYAAEIVSAVSHLHANGIMHRDLKPENVLLDAEGHAMLTDFGLAKQFEENTRSNSLCGTVEYMAPEILLGKGHDKAADWWSVGILLFEMLTGKPPYIGGNREKIQKKIIKDKVKLPSFLSSEAHSLLKGLLQKEANKRLGSGPSGSEEIKHHKWFKTINWKKLEAREIHPSFCPEVAGKHCTSNFDERWTNMSLLDSPASSPVATENSFVGFTYVRAAASFLQRTGSPC
ncbi:hypothetical protein IFM89_005365 [Coptis chinensis]|uniref:non-specific serine/threonine protein kinase n=1 Tax=Coptis chinensis TaxID=261450 RepID=A0A835HCD9_9MAGN|nr:hypothetical protein IFM89_005365 [Coptis chinensis]